MHIAIAILVLGFLILAHEFGHYIVGKKSGICVEEFAIGMGPKIVKWQRGETLYSIRLFPIGGFCRFLGEDEQENDPRSLNQAPVYKRFLTIFAGAFFNIVLALLLAFFLMFAVGDTAVGVDSFLEGSHAEEAGMQVGDVIYSIDGNKILLTGDIAKHTAAANGQTMEVVVIREGEWHTLFIDPYLLDGQWLVGIRQRPTVMRYGFFESMGRAFQWVFLMVKELYVFLFGLLTGKGTQGGVMGPVGTITVIGDVARIGFRYLISLMGMLSINLGVINLLPLPALDGGRLVFLLLEAVRGKPIPPEKEGMVHAVGMLLLFGLIIFLTYQDILALFTGLGGS